MANEPAVKTGTAIATRPHEQFRAYLQRRAEDSDGVRGYEIAQQQMDKILTAESDQDVWDADEGGTIAGNDFCDVEFRIHGFDIATSDDEFESVLNVYALIRGTLLQEWNGEPVGAEVLVNTGAPLIVTKLRMLELREMLPADVVIRGTKAKKGTVLKLRPVPKRAASGTVA